MDDFLNTNSAVFSKESTASEALPDGAHRQSPDEILSPAHKECVLQDKENSMLALGVNEEMDIMEEYFSQPLGSEHVDILLSAEDENASQNCSWNQASYTKYLPALPVFIRC